MIVKINTATNSRLMQKQITARRIINEQHITGLSLMPYLIAVTISWKKKYGRYRLKIITQIAITSNTLFAKFDSKGKASIFYKIH